MYSDATVVVPFDDRVIVVRLLNCPEFSSRLTEVAQPLYAVSGLKLLASGNGLGQPWLLGSVRVGGCAPV